MCDKNSTVWFERQFLFVKFQFYAGDIEKPKPLGFVSLDRLLETTKTPHPTVIDIFNRIAEAERSGNLELKKYLKQNYLYTFTPCVNVSEKRNYDSIIKWTGLAVLDFDHIDNAADFRDALFNRYRFIIAAWLSPSKRGVKALVSIPVCTSVDEFKQRHNSLSHEMSKYLGFDDTTKNCVLPLFQSFDADLKSRVDWYTYTGIIPVIPETIPPPKYNFTGDPSKYKYRIIKMIDTGIDKIVSDGHPQLRGLCFAIGGYVANGYIDEYEAIQYINYKIQFNNYLSKGIKGYQKTAKTMIQKGKQKPLSL